MSPRVDSLRVQSAALRALRIDPASSAAVAAALHALESKHEGLQSLGATLLGLSALPQAVPPLRALVHELRDRPKAFGLRRVVIRALVACASADDAPWVIDFCFGDPVGPSRDDAISLLRSLPHATWLHRVAVECSHSRVEHRRLAALALSFSAVPPGQQIPLLQPLLQDPDRGVRALARFQLARLEPSAQPNPGIQRTRYARR